MGNGGSILPWDDWFYHVNAKKSEVNTLHGQAVALQDSIKAEVVHYNDFLGQVQQLFSGNSALVIITKALQFDDARLKDFEVQLQLLPDPPKGVIAAKFGSFLAEITGSVLVLKAVVNLATLAKNAAFAGTETSGEVGIEGLAETGTELGVEAGVEAGVEVGVEAGLADTGVGIIAAVGLDAVFGAINGAKEAQELDDQISKLNTAVGQLNVAKQKLDAQFSKLQTVATQEQQRFKGVVNDLQRVIPYKSADAWQQLPADLTALPKYLAAQMEALRYYGLLSQLRLTYLKALERSSKVDKEAIITAVLLGAKAEVTHDQLEDLWAILEKFSTGMKALSAK